MNLNDLLKNPNFQDHDLRDDLVFYMRKDPAFFRKAYYPAMCELDDKIDSGKETSATDLLELVKLGAYNYVKKFGLQETVGDVFDQEDLEEIAEFIYDEESKKCKEGEYSPLDEDVSIDDGFDIMLSESEFISTSIVDVGPDGVIIHADEFLYNMFESLGFLAELKQGNSKDKRELFAKQIKDLRSKGFYRAADDTEKVMKDIYKKDNRSFSEMELAAMEGGQSIDDVSEAEYQGRNVPLGKPMAGDVKKSKVYVRGPKGNVVKVNFGDKKMKIKKSNPARRKSFRARHNCDNPGPRHKARYWSCRAW